MTGLIELPDNALTIDGTYPASSVIVTSAPSPSAVAGAIGLDFVASATNLLNNAFQVVAGQIVTGTVDFFSFIDNPTDPDFSLDFSPTGGGSPARPRGVLANTTPDPDIVVDSGNTGNLEFARTPEPTSVITLIGVGVLGVASKLKKKA